MMLTNAGNDVMKDTLTRNMAGLGQRPFSFRDRLYQLGLLRDPRQSGSAG
jgi:hypothetical protein